MTEVIVDTIAYSFASWLTGAVHEILFREGDQLACGIEVLSLQRACGAEGPAGTTLTLCNITFVCIMLKHLLPTQWKR